VYCQLFDSIYGDVQLSRVKFEPKMEYEYVNNFKALQACFDKHKIDKSIPVTKLVKCKMQDNLEFTQWVKKYWDSYYPGGEYDAVGRRQHAGAKTVHGGHGGGSGGGGASSYGGQKSAPAKRAPSAGKHVAASGRASAQSGRASPAVDHHSAAMVQDLTRQMTEMRITVDGLEKERDFYFQKLRDIEVLVQERLDAALASGAPEATVLGEIQQILYSTEEGFEAEGQGQYEEDVF
jgi:RP/EB family microtubule-associated protein